MSKHLSYDATNMWSGAVKAGGATRAEWKQLVPRLKKAHQRLAELQTSGEQGFFDLPFDKQTVSLVIRESKNLRARFRDVVVIGIGGSDLGARTIWQALGNQSGGATLHFLSNPDPEDIAPWMGRGKAWKDTAIIVVSKSGSTLETMAIFTALRESLIRAVGKKRHGEHIWAITDLTGGILHTIATQNGYAIIPHPLNVGGRFAVLSSVGLFPAACAGVDVRKMLAGARSVEQDHRELGAQSDVALFAGLHFLAYEKRHQRIHVLMPYASALQSFGFWYRQIWAESLGKKKDRRHVGPTPVAALGSVDQHSQIQLYTEGPADKVVTFIHARKFREDMRVPSAWNDVPELAYISGHTFEDIMDAEFHGTAYALTKSQTPNGTLEIPSITPESLGALFQFYELTCAYMGELFEINAYNQPGVEEGKRRAKEILQGNQ